MPPTVPRLQVTEYEKVESLRAWQGCGGVIPAVEISCFAFGTPLQHRHAIRVRCGFGKTTIVDSLKKGRWIPATSQRWMGNGRTIWIADAHRGDGKRFVVRADETLTAFLELE